MSNPDRFVDHFKHCNTVDVGLGSSVRARAARPFYPQEQISSACPGMSIKCHEETHAPQQLPALFDRLVGAQQERFRYREAERLGGFEIDD
jgi:hypothetical protein